MIVPTQQPPQTQSMNRPARRSRASGFTLVEIAVVLVIVGLITAGIAALMTTFLKSTRSRVAADNAAVVQQSLQRFIERYGRLPCPAIPTLAPGAVGYGVEDTVATSCPNVAVGATGMARGVVPWVTLGLPADQVQDGYARMFSYNVTIAATQTNASTVSAMRGNMTIHTGTPIALGLAPTGNQINSCMNTTAPPAGGDDLNGCNMRAVVVLLSHGENGFGAFTSQGGQVTAPTDASEVENTDANVNFVKGENMASGFDDVLFAWAPDDLLEPLARQGSIRSATAITNDTLRNTAIQLSNAIVNSATCPGVPPPPCSATATIPIAPPLPPPAQPVSVPPTITMPNDGWATPATAQPLIYSTANSGSHLCDGTLPAGTVAFALTSVGVDGVLTIAPATNPATNRNDDTVLNITVDQMRSQINTRFGAGACL
jgi:prepilin-type N-terminal cleavage/methylation domain-containing protein